MNELEQTVGEKGISRRKMLAVLGAGALAATAGAVLNGPKVFGETVTGSVYGNSSITVGPDVIVTTIANLRTGTTSPVAGNVYYVTDKDREGEFTYDPADTTTVDDNGITFVSVSGARFKRTHVDNLNVRWFGAKGDNVTDDSAAFQKAIDIAEARVGGTVYAPAGKYVVTNLKVKNHYVSIRGEGFQSTYLVNRHLTNPVLDVQLIVVPPAVQGTITNFELSDLMIKNEIHRPGDYPLVYSSKLVGSRITGVYFQNSTALVGGSHYNGSGVRLVDAFEVRIHSCSFRQFQKGYALDMPNFTVNVGNIHVSDCLFMYCGHAFLYGRGGGSMANSILITNPKFVGWQGGFYVSQNRVRYYQTTATAAVADSDYVPVPDASKFTANECVLVGSQARVTPAVITLVDPVNNRIRLNKTVKINNGDTVLQGTVAIHCGWRAQEVKLNIGHFEGHDVGVYASNRLGLITIDGVHSGSTSNVVIVDDQVQYLSIMNSRFFYNDANKVMKDWWTVVRITKIDDSHNVILLDNNYMSPTDAEQFMARQIINHTAHQPFVRISDRTNGIQYSAEGFGTTYHDTFYQTYNRTSLTNYTRQRWQDSGADKWTLDFKDSQGDLGYKLAGQTKDSLLLDGVGGHVGSGGSAWNEPHLRLGDYHLWVDNSGQLRIKNGAPTSATDGKRFNTNNGGGNGN